MENNKRHSIIIIIGVSGCGKSTIGSALAQVLDIPFYDADDFHPEANIKKMASGKALNDEDRKPWLTLLAKNMQQWTINGDAVLACSALKEDYRTLLATSKVNIQWVYLSGSFQLIKDRLENRSAHFMQSELLQSQFQALELPDYGAQINIDQSPEQIINTIIKALQ